MAASAATGPWQLRHLVQLVHLSSYRFWAWYVGRLTSSVLKAGEQRSRRNGRHSGEGVVGIVFLAITDINELFGDFITRSNGSSTILGF